jgi:hypothetical protein
MQVSVIVIAHNNFDNLQNIVTALNHKSFRFYIHIDKKVKLAPVMQQLASANNKNIFFLPKRSAVSWGGFSLVDVTLRLIDHALREKFDYLMLLSAQHLPLQPANDILAFLEKNHGKEFLHYNSLPYAHWNGRGGLDRLEYYWFVDELGYAESNNLAAAQKNMNMKRALPGQLTPYGGSQWWILTYDCIKGIRKFISNNDAYTAFFKKTLIPDETFFHTLIMNSDFSEDVINDNQLYVDWNKGPHFPRILTMDDWDAIKTSGKLFARKFSAATDANIIDTIMRNVSGVSL